MLKNVLAWSKASQFLNNFPISNVLKCTIAFHLKQIMLVQLVCIKQNYITNYIMQTSIIVTT